MRSNLFYVCLTWLTITLVATAQEADVSFHRDVLPILRVNCFSCHKPNKAKGGVDLTTHNAFLRGGDTGPIIAAGDAKKSKLIESICGEEPEMPKDAEPLSAREIALISRWITQGAKSDEHAEARTRRPDTPPTYTSLPAIHAMSLSPDGAFLAVPGHHEILLHSTDGLGIVKRLLGDSPRLESVAFSRDGTILVASGGSVSEFGEVQIWDAIKLELLRSIKASNDSFYGVSISPDNHLVAVGCADKLVRVFSIAEGKEVMRCDNHLDWVFGSAFTNDSERLVSVSRDKSAKLIEIATGHLVDDINQSRDPLVCLSRHPMHNQIATGGTDGKIRLFKMEPRGGRLAEGDNKENSFVREYEHMASPIQAIAFSPDGILVACSAESGEVRIFKTENGHRVTQIHAKQGPVFALAFTADGKQIATGGYDGRIRFYDTEKGELRKDIEGVPCKNTSGSQASDSARSNSER